jgi:transcriptional regulator with XRE-family HTH domain
MKIQPVKITVDHRGRDHMTFGERLCVLMAIRELTAGDLAARMGLHDHIIADWLTGKVLPTGHSIRWLAEFFAITSVELLDGNWWTGGLKK